MSSSHDIKAEVKLSKLNAILISHYIARNIRSVSYHRNVTGSKCAKDMYAEQ